MGCNKFKTSKAKAKNYLVTKEIIDKYNNILNLNEFRKTIKLYNIEARKFFEKADEDIKPIYENKLGTKVIFNEEFFSRVDAKKGIFYKKNLKYKGISDDFSKVPTKDGYYIKKVNKTPLNSPNEVVTNFPTITKEVVKLHSLKKSYISLAWKKYLKNQDEIKRISKDAGTSIITREDSKRRRELKDENEKLSERISKINEEALKLEKKIKVSDINILSSFIESEIETLNQLIDSYTPENEILASNIADTLVELGKIDYSDFEGRNNEDSHILFNRDMMFDKNRELKLDPKLVEKLVEWGRIGKKSKALINQRGESMLVEIAQTQGTDTLKQMKKKNVAKLMKFPLKEITLFDMYFMDITNGVFSHNGVIPQLMKHILDTVSEKSLKNVRDVGDSLANSHKRLVAYFDEHPELKRKYSLKSKLGLNKIDYKKLFLKVDEKGMRLSNIYTQDFYTTRDILYNKFIIALLKADKKTNEQARSNSKKIAYRDFNNSMNRFIEHIQPAHFVDGDLYDALMVYTPYIDKFFGNYDLGKGIKLRKFFNKLNDKNSKQDYVNSLNKRLTSNAVDKIKVKVARKVNDFLEERKDFFDKVLTDEDRELAKQGKPFTEKTSKLLYEFEINNNPIFTQFFFENKVDGKSIKTPLKSYNNSWLNSRFNITIPKSGRYLDSQYQEIHNDDVLTDIFNEFKNAWDLFEGMMPKKERDKLIDGQIIYSKQVYSEMIHTGKRSLDSFIQSYFIRSIDNFKKKITFKKSNEVTYAHVDSKGRKTYKINPAFIKANRRKIERKKNILKSELFFIASKEQGVPVSTFKQVKRDIAIEFLTPLLEKHNSKISNFKGSTPYVIETALAFVAENELAMESSFDLPKILHTMVSLAQDYKFRDEALPTLTFLQNHYSQIKTRDTDLYGDGITGDELSLKNPSQRRLTQSESWFKNVVLGDFSPTEKALFMNEETKPSKLETLAKRFKMGWLVPKVRKIRTSDEKNEVKNLQTQLDNMEDEYQAIKKKGDNLSEEDKAKVNLYNKLKNDLDSIGSLVSGTDIIQGVMYYLRTMALGWNLNSGATNFIEGQISNHTNAIRLGIPPEDLNIVTPQDLMKAKTLSQGKINEETWKALQLIDSYDMFQNGANEIQRAESNKKRERYKKAVHPFFITEQVEYLNQIPLMVAMMKNFEIKGVNEKGVIKSSNLFDALTRVEHEDGSFTLELRKEFKTEENVNNFELKDGEMYSNLKSWINKAITDGHGLYGANDSILIKDGVGAPAIMYKNWLPRMMYVWLGTRQRDIRGRIHQKGSISYEKGKLRSITPSQALLLGIGGAIITSPLLGIATGTIGALAAASKVSGGKVLGNSEFGIQTTYGFARQLVFESKILLMKMVGMLTSISPSKTLRKKYNSHTLTREMFNKFNEDNKELLTKEDLLNFESNMQSLSQLFIMFAFYVLIKSVAPDDDDKDSLKKKTANYLANKLMQLSSQTAMYSNPFKLRTTLSDTAIVTFFENLASTVTSFEGFVTGNDTIKSGTSKGESKFFNSFSKTLVPPAFRNTLSSAVYKHSLALPTLGLSNPSKKQYVKGSVDNFFRDKYNKLEDILKMKRAKRRAYLESSFKGDKKRVRAELAKEGYYIKKDEKKDLKLFEKLVNEL